MGKVISIREFLNKVQLVVPDEWLSEAPTEPSIAPEEDLLFPNATPAADEVDDLADETVAPPPEATVTASPSSATTASPEAAKPSNGEQIEATSDDEQAALRQKNAAEGRPYHYEFVCDATLTDGSRASVLLDNLFSETELSQEALEKEATTLAEGAEASGQFAELDEVVVQFTQTPTQAKPPSRPRGRPRRA